MCLRWYVVGALLFGYIGDRYGAKRALELSLFLMAIPTFLIGCLPTYNQVGWLSVVLLSLMRLLQGVSVGGQLTSSVIFILEKRDKKVWGLYGSYVMISGVVGTLLGSLLAYVIRSTLSDSQLKDWGWRIPFILGIFLCIPSYYLKFHSTDAPRQENHIINPIVEAFRPANRRSLISVILVNMLTTSSFYLTFIWMPIFMEDLIDPPQNYGFLITSLALLISLIIVQPIPGFLSDKYSRKKIMTPGALSIIFLGPLSVYVASTRNTIATFFSQLFLGIAIGFWGAPLPALMMESFPQHIRLTSVSVGYNIATSTVGGFSPVIATLMVDNVGLSSPGCLYVIFAIFSLLGLYYLPIIDLNIPFQDVDDVLVPGIFASE